MQNCSLCCFSDIALESSRDCISLDWLSIMFGALRIINGKCPLKAMSRIKAYVAFHEMGWLTLSYAYKVMLKFTKQLVMVGAYLKQLLLVSVQLKPQHFSHLRWHIDFRSVVRKSKCRLLNNPFEGPLTIFMPGYASSVGIFSGDSLTSGPLPYILQPVTYD